MRSGWVSDFDQNRLRRTVLFALLMFAGAAARIFVAWTLRDSASSDHGVPCLMAKHIAELREFPVFYYGQPYMGSLEPFFSAIFCRILGVSGFAVNLGTALFGIALLPLVYAWGRRAGGAVAGLAAMLFCVVGPFGFFQFQSWSYGGYSAIVFFCTLLVFGAALIVAREHKEKPLSLLAYLCIGLVAGAAWWTAPHTLPAILTAALLLASGIRLKLFGWRAVLGVVGFAAGSLPFWIWNVQNEWGTFSFLMAGAHSNLWHGVRVFFSSDMLRVLGLKPHPLVWVGYIAGCILFFAVLVRKLRPHISSQALFAFAPLLYLLVASLLAGGSRFAGDAAPERYLLHLIPPVAVMLGLVVALLAEKLPRGLGLLPIVAIFGWQLRTVPVFVRFSEDGSRYKEKIEEFAEVLEERGIENIYAPYPVRHSGHALNFMLDERFLFSDPRGERYPPYRRRIELASSVAVLNNIYGVTDFLKSMGVQADTAGVEKLRVHYNFKPPVKGLVELKLGGIDSSECVHAVDDFGNDIGGIIGDGDITTAWSSHPGDRQQDYLEFRWNATQAVHAVQLYSACGLYAHDMHVEWKSADGRWIKDSSSAAKYNGYFWSGERLYYRSDYFRQEYRFGPFATTALRLYIESEDRRLCEITELRLYAAVDKAAAASDTAVLAEIERLGLDRVYADRWMANRVYEKFGGKVATTINRRVSKDKSVRLEPEMSFTAETGIVVPDTMRGSCDMALVDAGFGMSKKEFHGAALYYFTPDNWHSYYAGNHSFIWSGVGCLKRSDRNRAVYLSSYADYLWETGELDQAIRVLEDAVEIFEALPKGRERLITWYGRTGDNAAALLCRTAVEKYREKMTPKHRFAVGFGDDITLEGISISPEQSVPGGIVDIEYFWHCSEDLITTDWAVFVHFIGVDGNVEFQDDHVLLENESVNDQPVPVMFREQRRIVLPNRIRPGRCSIRVGVYGRAEKKGRLRVKGEYSSFRRHADLPVSVRIGYKK